MEKIKILAIYHNSKSKAGKEYISKKGQPYELCSIKDDKGYLSGFGNTQTKLWKIGDEVNLEVTVNGDFRNFKIPDDKVTREEFEIMKKKVKFLDDEVAFLHKEIETLKLGENTRRIEEDFPEPESLDLGDEPEIGEAI